MISLPAEGQFPELSTLDPSDSLWAGPTGISGTNYLPPPSAPIIRDINAIVAMRNALMAQPYHCTWLVATGPLTNVGLLFATFPKVGSHTGGLSIMGGAVGDGFTGVPSGKTLGQSEGFGNETPWARIDLFLCNGRRFRSLIIGNSRR